MDSIAGFTKTESYRVPLPETLTELVTYEPDW
jgi:hypothetical protein